MSESKDDGGPAFPQAVANPSRSHQGMSLRDYFAGRAIAGRGELWGALEIDAADKARDAYRVADAMLAERSRSTPSE